MPRFIYVVVLRYPTDGEVGFKHAWVEAADEQDAYDAGFKAVWIAPEEGRVNDYVVPLAPDVAAIREAIETIETVKRNLIALTSAYPDRYPRHAFADTKQLLIDALTQLKGA